MTIPLERRAHVLVVYNSRFIGELKGILPGTERVYYSGIAFKVPPHRDVSDVAMELATTKDPNTTERLELETVNQFTAQGDQAMTFMYNEVYEEAEKLQSKIGVRVSVHILDEEWLPF